MTELTSSSGGRYRLAGEPRVGGQARVFPAADEAGRQVAIKLAKDAGENSHRLDRERAELERLKAEHPGASRWVVDILDHGRSPQGEIFLVLPWYEQTLAEWVQGRGPAERLLAAEKACEAVTRLHRGEQDWREGVVHRDIKPQNFLVSGNGEDLQVLLADFGGAKRSSRGASWSVGTGIHTVGYAPPDQLLPRKTPPDRSWDIYALAVTVYWCLTGRRPYGTDEAAGLFTRQGRQLLSLAEQVSSSTASSPQQQRFQSLSLLPVSELVDVDRIEPLLGEDREDLRAVFGGPEAIDWAEDLEDALLDALQPDPGRRNPDSRVLQRACARLRRRLARQPRPSAAPALQQHTVQAAWDKQALEAAVTPSPAAPPLAPSPQTVQLRPSAPAQPPPGSARLDALPPPSRATPAAPAVAPTPSSARPAAPAPRGSRLDALPPPSAHPSEPPTSAPPVALSPRLDALPPPSSRPLAPSPAPLPTPAQERVTPGEDLPPKRKKAGFAQLIFWVGVLFSLYFFGFLLLAVFSAVVDSRPPF
jgi:serine/threonine protein kinase